jgi:hypothetical protein
MSNVFIEKPLENIVLPYIHGRSPFAAAFIGRLFTASGSVTVDEWISVNNDHRLDSLFFRTFKRHIGGAHVHNYSPGDTLQLHFFKEAVRVACVTIQHGIFEEANDATKRKYHGLQLHLLKDVTCLLDFSDPSVLHHYSSTGWKSPCPTMNGSYILPRGLDIKLVSVGLFGERVEGAQTTMDAVYRTDHQRSVGGLYRSVRPFNCLPQAWFLKDSARRFPDSAERA